MELKSNQITLIPFQKDNQKVFLELLHKKTQEILVVDCVLDCVENEEIKDNLHCEGYKIWLINCDQGGIIGAVVLQKINKKHETGKLVIMFEKNEHCQVKDLFNEVVDLVLKYVFINLNLLRVEVEILDSNLNLKQSFEKYGFLEEGLLRSKYYLNEKRYDVFVMSMLKVEWERLKR